MKNQNRDRKPWVLEWRLTESGSNTRRTIPAVTAMDDLWTYRNSRKRTIDGWVQAGKPKTFTTAVNDLLELTTVMEYYHWRIRNKRTGEVIPLEALA